MKQTRLVTLIIFAALTLGLAAFAPAQTIDPSLKPEEIKSIAKDVFFWGMTPAGAYEMRYLYTQLESAHAYVGKNRVGYYRKRIRASDREINGPNYTTIYGWGFFDLRDGPIVILTPEITGRYWSVQMSDQYARWYAPIGSPFTGNAPQKHLIVGPTYLRPLPAEFKGVEISRAPSDYVYMNVRIALRNDTDTEIAAVNYIQDHMTIVSMRDWEANGRKPLAAKDQKPVRAAYATFPRMAEITDFAAKMTAMDLMQLVSLVLNDPSMTKRTDSIKEVETLKRLAKLGLAEGRSFDPKTVTEAQQKAIEAGFEEAKREGLAASMRSFMDMNGWKLTSSWNADYNDYPVMGYWGMAALFGPIPFYSHTAATTFTDADGQPLDGSRLYTMTFDVKNLPPVTEFWEIAVYDPYGYFVENEINRYAVNSYMYKNGDFSVKDGKLTFYIQKDKPSAPDQLKNWLPSAGKFHIPVRFYGPMAPLIDGNYDMPKVVRVK